MDALTLALQIVNTIKASGENHERVRVALNIAHEVLRDVEYSGEWPDEHRRESKSFLGAAVADRPF